MPLPWPRSLKTFGGICQGPVDDSPFWNIFEPFLPAPQTPPCLPKFSEDNLRKVAHAMCGKAAGLDGFSAKAIASLPMPALHRLAQLLDLFEEKGQLPKGLQQWTMEISFPSQN